jgi:hypothetical protein
VAAGDNVTGTVLTMTIPDGLYSGSKTATASNTNLTTANIRSGVSIFGVPGASVVLSEMSARPMMPAGWPKPEFPVVQQWKQGSLQKMSDDNKTKIEFEESSGNVFADLGFEDANELFERAQLGFNVTKYALIFDVIENLLQTGRYCDPCN